MAIFPTRFQQNAIASKGRFSSIINPLRELSVQGSIMEMVVVKTVVMSQEGAGGGEEQLPVSL